MNEIAILLGVSLILGAAIILVRHLREGIGKSSPCFEYGLELLESRIAPAALAAKFNGGLLSITGDAETNTVNVIDVSGSIEVLDGGTSLGTFSNVKNIKINVQGGGFVNVNLSNNGIPGSISATTVGTTTFALVSNSSMNGGFSLKGDTTAQTLLVEAGVQIGKSLTYNGSAGADSFSIFSNVNIGGAAAFVSVESGQFETTANSTTIAGSLRFTNTATPLPVTIETAGANGLIVSGKVSYAGGTNNDSLFLKGTVDGNASFLDRSGNNSFGLGEGSTLRSSLKMITGDGNDGFGIQGGTVTGNVALKLGNGNNSFSYGIAASVTVGGNVSMITGAGNDGWRTSGLGMTIAGNVTMSLGDGLNEIIASAIMNGSKFNVTTGSGTDVVSIDGTATNTSVRISLGGGNDDLAGTLIRANASATFDGGAGTDRFIENMLTTDPLLIIGFENFS